jgi:AbrB family looped-hinge helix DNA binding protein
MEDNAMIKKQRNGGQFYGTTTLGERGQVVIPAEAREAMGLKKGEKLLVFGMGCDMITLTKLSKLEQFESHLAGRLAAIREIMRKTQ